MVSHFVSLCTAGIRDAYVLAFRMADISAAMAMAVVLRIHVSIGVVVGIIAGVGVGGGSEVGDGVASVLRMHLKLPNVGCLG